ncbi:MAG: hypothetical protein RL738_168 [Bacteroidota bacterium]
MTGHWVAPLAELGIGAALEALRAEGLASAPMMEPLDAERMRQRAARFPEARRALLVEVLREQVGPSPSPEQLALLDRLAQPDSVTVVAGHQLVTALGPLYVHAKVAETEALAAFWTAQGVPTVPVFWMATEDHDLDEIRRIFWRGTAVGAWAPPVGAYRSGVVDAQPVADALEAWVRSAALPEPVRIAAERSIEAYRGSANLTEATRRLMAHYHPGVLVLDASDARLKAAAAELWADEIQNQTLYGTAEVAALPWKGRDLPVPMRPSALFALDAQGRRSRLDRHEDGTWTSADGRSWGSDADVAAWAADHPERVSPNALLRPVYQEFILPNAAYTGGAGELAYAYQLVPYWKNSGRDHGVWRLRHSGMWVPAAADKARAAFADQNFGGTWNPKTLRDQILQSSGAPDPARRPVLDAVSDLVRRTYAKPGLEASAEAWLRRIEREEARMVERLRREAGHREAVALRRLDLLAQTLLPSGTLQERIWTHFDLVEHGGPIAVAAYVEAYLRQPHWDVPGWWEFR